MQFPSTSLRPILFAALRFVAKAAAMSAAVFFVLICPCNAQGTGADIEFGFNSKPPLFYFENGIPQGDVVNVVQMVCQQAALKCLFSELPFQRVMAYLEQRKPNFAALGFSKTPEREKFVKFSEPVWRDAAPVIMVRADSRKAFQAYATFADMATKSNFVFGGKEGNVYPIDSTLRLMGKRDQRFSTEATKFPLLLVAGRFDFTMLYPSEILPALQDSSIVPSAVTTISYPDLPLGMDRYLLFSEAVSAELIQRVNVAIKALISSGKIKALR